MSHSPTIETTRKLSPRKCEVHVAEKPNGITRDAQQCIKNCKYFEVRLVECELCEGLLFLRGRVSSFYLKQLAQEVVRSLDGIECIVNHVEVIFQDSAWPTGSVRKPAMIAKRIQKLDYEQT